MQMKLSVDHGESYPVPPAASEGIEPYPITSPCAGTANRPFARKGREAVSMTEGATIHSSLTPAALAAEVCM